MLCLSRYIFQRNVKLKIEVFAMNGLIYLLIISLQATLASGPGFLRRDRQQEVYCKLWGTADKPPANLHIGDNVKMYNVQVWTYRSMVSLTSTDDTICKVCYVVTLCTVVILALLLPAKTIYSCLLTVSHSIFAFPASFLCRHAYAYNVCNWAVQVLF